MGRQIERHRQPLLPRREVAAVESVALLGGRETRILPDRPRPPGIHRRIRPTRVGRDARVARLDVRRIFRPIDGLEGDPLDRLAAEVGAAGFLGGKRLPLVKIVVGHCTPCSSPLAGEDTKA